MRDFLLAFNQGAQFRLRHNLGNIARLAALMDNENIVHNQRSDTVQYADAEIDRQRFSKNKLA